MMEDPNKLVWAIKTGDMEEVEAKIKTSDDANRTLSGRKPLHYAADFGQEAVIKFLVSKGADINAADKHGITPLISAIYEDHVSCVKVLLEKGANKDCKGPDGVCALESAKCCAIKDLLK